MQVMLGKTFQSFKVADNSNLIQKETWVLLQSNLLERVTRIIEQRQEHWWIIAFAWKA